MCKKKQKNERFIKLCMIIQKPIPYGMQLAIIESSKLRLSNHGFVMWFEGRSFMIPYEIVDYIDVFSMEKGNRYYQEIWRRDNCEHEINNRT